MDSDDALSKETCDGIFTYVENLLKGATHKSLYASWYGGEPMLHVDAIEYLSGLLMEFCASNEVRFSGHMATNGTCWPSAPHECVSSVIRHKIKHIQFSFDGLAENHNKRRHYLEKHPDRPDSGLFGGVCQSLLTD